MSLARFGLAASRSQLSGRLSAPSRASAVYCELKGPATAAAAAGFWSHSAPEPPYTLRPSSDRGGAETRSCTRARGPRGELPCRADLLDGERRRAGSLDGGGAHRSRSRRRRACAGRSFVRLDRGRAGGDAAACRARCRRPVHERCRALQERAAALKHWLGMGVRRTFAVKSTRRHTRRSRTRHLRTRSSSSPCCVAAVPAAARTGPGPGALSEPNANPFPSTYTRVSLAPDAHPHVNIFTATGPLSGTARF